MFLLFGSCAYAQPCPQVTLLTQFSKGESKAAIVAAPADFAALPRWTPGEGPPPLAADAAIKAATAAISRQPERADFRVEDVMLSRVSCEALKDYWFYRVAFNRAGPPRDFQDAVAVIVMMDGSVRGPLPMFPKTIEQPKAPPPEPPAKPTLGFDPLVPAWLYEGDTASHFAARPAFQLLDDADFPQLESELDRLRDGGAVLKDGQSHYVAVMSGLTDSIGNNTGWDKGIETVQSWRRRFPKSVHAAIIEANAWRAYAWQARGSGFANQVPAKAFELYGERLARARRVLEEAKPFAATNPLWYTSMLGVANSEGWPVEKQREVFAEGVARHPRASGIYVTMAHRMTPRWGGNIAMYREFTDLAARETQRFYGNSMYAWMYLQYADVENDQPFRDLGIPWQQMKSGFDELLARYPSTWNLNVYAYFACQADDKAAFLALLPRLTKESVRQDVWRGGYQFDTCRATFTAPA
jgi:hypothetical protein